MVDRNLLREFQVPDEVLDAEIAAALGGGGSADELLDSIIVAEGNLAFEPGRIVPGKVIRIEGDDVLVDVGYKSEGMVPLEEWNDGPEEPEPGSQIEVLLEDFEDEFGLLLLSKRKADRIRQWEEIINKHDEGDVVTGTVVRKIKGGLLVNIGVKRVPAGQSGRHPPSAGHRCLHRSRYRMRDPEDR